MTLQWTGTWEHALLAATAQEAAASGSGGYLGLAAFQKILYFLQIAGVPMRYTFDVYGSGPFCERICLDVEWLVVDEVLTDASPCPAKHADDRPDKAAGELLQAHAEALTPYQATITKVVRSLLPLEPDHLELLTTLNYQFRWLRAGGGGGPWKERVLDRFMQAKKDKFPREAVLTAYDTMVGAGLIQA